MSTKDCREIIFGYHTTRRSIVYHEVLHHSLITSTRYRHLLASLHHRGTMHLNVSVRGVDLGHSAALMQLVVLPGVSSAVAGRFIVNCHLSHLATFAQIRIG